MVYRIQSHKNTVNFSIKSREIHFIPTGYAIVIVDITSKFIKNYIL